MSTISRRLIDNYLFSKGVGRRHEIPQPVDAHDRLHVRYLPVANPGQNVAQERVGGFDYPVAAMEKRRRSPNCLLRRGSS
jgi:hypothetical protein